MYMSKKLDLKTMARNRKEPLDHPIFFTATQRQKKKIDAIKRIEKSKSEGRIDVNEILRTLADSFIEEYELLHGEVA